MNEIRLFMKASTDGFSNQPGYQLKGNPPRWHKVDEGAANGGNNSSHDNAPTSQQKKPKVEGKPITFTDDQLAQLKSAYLPEGNVNAATYNKQLDQLLELGAKGDAEAILSASYGSNHYAKKMVLIANTLLSSMGIDAEVKSSQKKFSHPLITGEVELKNQENETKPEKSIVKPSINETKDTISAINEEISVTDEIKEPEVKSGDPIQDMISQIPFEDLKLPESNSNAKSVNKKIDEIEAAAKSGDINKILAMPFGSNPYAKKQVDIANTVLAAYGSEFEVSVSQKANSHTALNGEVKQEAKPETKPDDKPIASLRVKSQIGDVKDGPEGKEQLTKDGWKKASEILVYPPFDSVQQMEEWASNSQGYQNWKAKALAIYGTKEAVDKSPESKKFDQMYSDLVDAKQKADAILADKKVLTFAEFKELNNNAVMTIYDANTGKKWRSVKYKDGNFYFAKKSGNGWMKNPISPTAVYEIMDGNYGKVVLDDPGSEADNSTKDAAHNFINETAKLFTSAKNKEGVTGIMQLKLSIQSAKQTSNGSIDGVVKSNVILLANGGYQVKSGDGSVIVSKDSDFYPALDELYLSIGNKISEGKILKNIKKVNDEISDYLSGDEYNDDFIKNLKDGIEKVLSNDDKKSALSDLNGSLHMWPNDPIADYYSDDKNETFYLNGTGSPKLYKAIAEMKGKLHAFAHNQEYVEPEIPNGTEKIINGKNTIYADGKWHETEDNYTVAPEDQDGPKDGDTKPGANGTLVFKDGRWHKQDEQLPTPEKAYDDLLSSVSNLALKTDAKEEAMTIKDPELSNAIYEAVIDIYGHSPLLKQDIEKNSIPLIEGVNEVLSINDMGTVVLNVDGNNYYYTKDTYPAIHKYLSGVVNAVNNLPKSKAVEEEKPKAAANGMSEETAFTLKYKDDKSDKFWSIWLSGNSVFTKYGKTGSKGKITEKEINPTNMPKGAIAYCKKLIKSKMTKGYSVDKASIDIDVIEKQKEAMSPTPKNVDISGIPVSSNKITPMDSWEQIGPQGGSNPGGKFKDPLGGEWYVKFPADEDIAKSEVLAANLYALAGIDGQKAILISKNGKTGIASKWTEVSKGSVSDIVSASGALDGFATDAWLANWDVVGLNFDNLMIDKDGKAVRIDAGGSLEYRAQGSAKPFGHEVLEMDSLLDPNKNPNSAAIFGKMSVADINASVVKVLMIPDADIKKVVEMSGIGNKAHQEKLAETLIKRKQYLANKYPAAAKLAKQKTFDPGKISSPPDFLNWSGQGNAGPSSKMFLNQANHDAAQDIYKMAKDGDIEAIKNLSANVYNKETGEVIGYKSVLEHPSQHIKGYAQQAINEVNYQLNKSYIGRISIGGQMDAYAAAFPKIKAHHFNKAEKIGNYLLLGNTGELAPSTPDQLGITKSNKSLTEVKSGLIQMSKESWSMLPSTQQQAIQAYTGNSYKKMNASLWNGNPSGMAASAAEGLNIVGHEIPEGLVLSRKMSISNNSMIELLMKSAGSVIQEPAIMSTSLNHGTWHGNVKLNINVGQGVKGLYVGPNSAGNGKSISTHAGEDEVIFPPGSRLLILKVEKDKNSTVTVDCVILPNN